MWKRSVGQLRGDECNWPRAPGDEWTCGISLATSQERQAASLWTSGSATHRQELANGPLIHVVEALHYTNGITLNTAAKAGQLA